MLDHLDDIQVDVLRFFPQYGRYPVDRMDGPLFLAVCARLVHYGGAVTAAFHQQQQQVQQAEPAPEPVAPRSLRAIEQARPATVQPEHDVSRIRIPSQYRRQEVRRVDLAALRAMNPDLIGHTTVKAG